MMDLDQVLSHCQPFLRAAHRDTIPTEVLVNRVVRALENGMRQEKCWICWSNEDRNVPAVAMCQELKQPVCEKHAAGCKEDGHAALPLED